MDHTSLSIRNILDNVITGRIRIPAFQRGFVWEMDKVAYFMDSIYKKYPFGSLLIWRTNNQLKSDKDLGPYIVPQANKDLPIDYVLDGQQRITSIFIAFQNNKDNVLKINSKNNIVWKDIYFDYSIDADAQESQFFALDENEVDTNKHFNLNVLFDSVQYRQATKNLSDLNVQKIDKLQETFKEASIPVQILKTEERATVAIVFERINRLGVELDTLQLLSAWTWSEDFDLLSKFKELNEELDEFGFGNIGDDTNLILRCCSAILKKDPSTKSLMDIKGNEVRDRFSEVINGIKGTIDFIKKEFKVSKLKHLPFSSMIIPLSVFFSTKDGTQLKHESESFDAIKKWFWSSCFTRRYTSQTDKVIKSDIDEMFNLKEGKPSKLYHVASVSREFFTENIFSLNTGNTKAFIIMMAIKNPKSFISGNLVDLQSVLQDYNRSEFHHIYPKAYLKSIATDEDKINSLSNFCFLSKTDNNTISKEKPSEYKNKMPKDPEKLSEILESALCPNSIFDDDFEKFLKERTDIIVEYANNLLNK